MLASIYNYIYLIIVSIMTFSIMSSYNGGGSRTRVYSSRGGMVALIITVLFFALAIGLRPVSRIFGDMTNYYSDYQDSLGSLFFFDPTVDNLLFDNILPWFASNSFPVEYFFLFIAGVYFGCVAWACIKLFPLDYMLAFVVYLGAFSTFSYGVNGIKAGAAASIFLLALAYREKKVVSVLFLLLSLGFHHSMLAPIVAYIMASVCKKTSIYFFAWIVCFLLAAVHITFFQSFFSGFTDDHGASYLTLDTYDKAVTGFRPDFILYSAVPIFVGYNLIRKYSVISETYNFLWCTYVATNCVFLLCTYANFINRIAYLSWSMYPIVLLYPFLNISLAKYPNISKRYLKYAVFGHLAFTVFMTFIYYA